MSKSQDLIGLAKSLPPKLIRFFARYPPVSIIPPSSVNNNSEGTQPRTHNPFKATRHPITNRWHNAVFSLRRQADLVKLAREHGVEELLPYTVKGTMERIRKRLKNGLRVKGTGIGQNVKGKASERTMKARLEKRRQAMLDMPQMIQTWKEVRYTTFACFEAINKLGSEVMVVDGRNGLNKTRHHRILANSKLG